MRSYPAQIGLGLGTPARPSTPGLSIVTGDGSVTATISGDGGVTHYLKYKGTGHSSWQDGGSRSGDGTLVVSGLKNDVPYIFIAYSRNGQGPVSLPAVAKLATLIDDTSNDFDELLEDTVSQFLDEFAEDIKYLPAGGGQREIRAIIDREPPTDLDGAPHGQAPRCTITVANNSTTGISSSEIDTGGDKVELAMRMGETVQQRRITKIASQDAGMMTLEVR